MAIYNPNLKPAGETVIRDYQHAARIFTDDQFRLSPKYGFLFYVEFDFHPSITNISNRAAQEMGMIVKSVNLPKYTIDTKIHNAYNRKNIVQNKISYDPVTIQFHDDQSDNVRSFWYDYYSYFYRDPDYADSTYAVPHKYQSRPAYDWGYTPKPGNTTAGNQPYQYIQSIRIYSLFQKNFSQYELINPIITSFKHGEHSNSGSAEMLSHEMSVQFETVKYYTGYVTKDNVGGFIDLHYDNTPSPIAVKVDDMDSTITDLASGDVSLAQVTSIINLPGLSSAASFPSAFAGSTAFASTTGAINAAGFSIPSLGSLSNQIPNASLLQQQLTAASAITAGRLVSSAANQVVGGLSSAIGANGQAVIGLAASAISNPKLFVSRVTNMATSYAMNYASKTVTAFAQPYINELKSTVASAASNLIGDAQAYLGAWSPDILASSSEMLGIGEFNATSGEFLGSLEF